jgi:hypothetical protein
MITEQYYSKLYFQCQSYAGRKLPSEFYPKLPWYDGLFPVNG